MIIKLFRSLLNSSYVIACIAIFNYPTLAAQITTNGNVTLNSPNNWLDAANQPLLLPPNSGDAIKIGGIFDKITANVPGFNILEINLNNLEPGDLIIEENVAIGSIYSTPGAPANSVLEISIAPQRQLELTGLSLNNANNRLYDRLSTITPKKEVNILVNAAGPIRLDNEFLGQELTSTLLEVASELTVTNATVAEIGTININDAVFSLNINGTPDFQNYIRFSGANPELQVIKPAKLSGPFISDNDEIKNGKLYVFADTTLGADRAEELGEININQSNLTIDIPNQPTFQGNVNFEGNSPSLTILQKTTYNGDFGGDDIANAVLNIDDDTIITTETVGDIGDIVILNNRSLSIIVDNDIELGNVTNGGGISFAADDSTLYLQNNSNETKIFNVNQNITGINQDSGIINLDGNILVSAMLPQSLGESNSFLKELNIGESGNLPTNINIGQNLSIYTDKLNIYENASLTINYDNLFSNETNLDGTMAVNITQNDTNFNDNMIFGENGRLEFIKPPTGINNSTVNISSNLTPTADNESSILLANDNTNGQLTFDGNDIGSPATRFSQVIIDGPGKIIVEQQLFTKDLTIGQEEAVGDSIFGKKIELGVDAKLSFIQSGHLTFEEGVSVGEIEFADTDSVIKLSDGAKLDSISIENGENASVVFDNQGSIEGRIQKLGILAVGIGNVNILTPGEHTIDNILANGNAILDLPENFILNGNIDNQIGVVGRLTLSFSGGDSEIRGSVGATSKIGDINLTIPDSLLTFHETSNVSNVFIARRAVAIFKKKLTAEELIVEDGAVIALAADSTANRLELEGATLAIDNNIRINMPIASTNSILQLNTNILKVDSAITLNGKTDILITTRNTGEDIGHIILSNITNPILTIPAGAEVDVTVDTEVAEAVFDKTYKLFDNNGGPLLGIDNNAKIIVKDLNRRIMWQYNRDGTVKATDGTIVTVIEPIINDLIEKGAENNLSKQERLYLATKIKQGLTKDVLNMIAKLPGDEGDSLILDLRSRTENPKVKDVALDLAYHTITKVIDDSVLNTIIKRTNNLNLNTLAAGDDTNGISGAWLSPIYLHGRHKMQNRLAGYKINAGGIVFGVDHKIYDDVLVGIALSYIDNHVKYKDQRQGDGNNIKSYILSLYGLKQLNKSFFLQGIAAAGHNKIHSYDRRGTKTIGFSVSKANYSAHNYTMGITFGNNNFIKDNVILTSLVGLRYAKFLHHSYRERSGDIFNFKFKHKSRERIEASLGLKLAGSIKIYDMSFNPEIYSFITHNFQNQKMLVIAKLPEAQESFPTKAIKPIATSYNIGTSILMQKNYAEYGANYNLERAKKYTGHQIALKLKLLF